MHGKLLQKLQTRPDKMLGNITKKTTPYCKDSIWPTCNSWCGILQFAILGHPQESRWKILDLLTWSNTQYGLTYGEALVFYRWCNSLNWPFFFHLNLAEDNVYITVTNEVWVTESQHCRKRKRAQELAVVRCFSCHRSGHLPLSPRPKCQLPLLAFAPFSGPTPSTPIAQDGERGLSPTTF